MFDVGDTATYMYPLYFSALKDVGTIDRLSTMLTAYCPLISNLAGVWAGYTIY